jgi:transposase InsO family protein
MALKQEITLPEIYDYLTNPNPPSVSTEFLKRLDKYYVKAGKMYRRTPERKALLVILDKARRLTLMTQAHDDLGHHGAKATWENLRTRFYWPTLHKDVIHHVKSCHECQIQSTKKIHIPITISPPITVFSKVHLDVMYMPKARGYQYIIVARDDLSKYVEGRALKAATGQAIADFVLQDIILRHGYIRQVVTDNGPEFQGACALLLRKYDIPQIRISPYNSQANGVVEQGHFAIREALVKACKGRIQDWPLKLRAVLFADNITVRRSTGYSAYYLLYGVEPVLPFDLTESTFLVEGFKRNLPTSELLALRALQLERREKDLDKAAETLKKARLQSKERFEKRFETRLVTGSYSPGELVLIRNSTIEKELNRKTKPRYLGPYEVIEQTKGSSYRLSELDGTKLARPVAAFRVIPYIRREDLQYLTYPLEEEEED